MSGTCKDCKWWDERHAGSGRGQCGYASACDESHDAIAVSEYGIDGNILLCGVLWTTPEWFCPKFESKDG